MSSLTAQAKQYPLKKPGGFHWDFFLLGCTTIIAGIFGIPLPNGLVPQAPVHTESLTVFETKLQIIPTSEGEGREIRRKIVIPSKVIEQRISHFVMGLAIIGTMTGPLLVVLGTMPRALFAGVFFVVGVRVSPSSPNHYSNQILPTVGLYRKQRHHQKSPPPPPRTPLHQHLLTPPPNPPT